MYAYCAYALSAADIKFKIVRISAINLACVAGTAAYLNICHLLCIVYSSWRLVFAYPLIINVRGLKQLTPRQHPLLVANSSSHNPTKVCLIDLNLNYDQQALCAINSSVANSRIPNESNTFGAIKLLLLEVARREGGVRGYLYIPLLPYLLSA